MHYIMVELISHLWSTINVKHQRFVFRDDKPGLLPAAATALLHVVQEAAEDTVLRRHRGLFLQCTRNKQVVKQIRLEQHSSFIRRLQ